MGRGSVRLDFRALGEAAAVFQPTPEEIAAFESAPAEAWQMLDALIGRAVRYGLRLV